MSRRGQRGGGGRRGHILNMNNMLRGEREASLMPPDLFIVEIFIFLLLKSYRTWWKSFASSDMQNLLCSSLTHFSINPILKCELKNISCLSLSLSFHLSLSLYLLSIYLYFFWYIYIYITALYIITFYCHNLNNCKYDISITY